MSGLPADIRDLTAAQINAVRDVVAAAGVSRAAPAGRYPAFG